MEFVFGLNICFDICFVDTGSSWAATPQSAPSCPQGTHATSNEAQWTILVYSDGDDPSIEESLVQDMQEMELAGSTDQVTIVTQSDRYKGGYAGLGDWTGAKRFMITQDDDMSSFGFERGRGFGRSQHRRWRGSAHRLRRMGGDQLPGGKDGC